MSMTPNLAMPLLFAAQAQKEITHNEAIVLLDALVPACVESVASDPDALTPDEGQVWIIGPTPVGLWTGRSGYLAVSSAGGWRFAPPVAGMRVFDRDANVERQCDGTIWLDPPAIADPAGGSVLDAEARAAIGALLDLLRTAGMITAT